MHTTCPTCATENRPAARFCARCGLPLARGPQGEVLPGRVMHPRPVLPPEGFTPCLAAADLHFRWESVSGGRPLIGTESLSLVLFNGGYPLEQVELEVRFHDAAGEQKYTVRTTVEHLPRAEQARIEIPSYDLIEPAADLTVALIGAEFVAQT